MRILCEVEEVDLENEDGIEVEGVVATCGRCQHSTESYGTHDRSRRRCLVMMREECPDGLNNYYMEA